MIDSLQRGLSDAIEETLQTMFFIVGDPDAPPDREARPEMEAVVAFTGDMAGRLRLRIASSEAAAMASDFLGVNEPEITVAHMDQVVGELANMICGSALSRIRPQGAFRIETPVVSSPLEDEGQAILPATGLPAGSTGPPGRPQRDFAWSVETRSGPLTAVLEVNA